MSKRNHVVVPLLLASSLWGCGPEGMTEPVEGLESGPVQDAPLATQTQELISAGEFYWDQTRTSATPMGSVYDRVCFLSRMTGHFAGGGESIHAFTSGSSWYLSGNSQQAGMSARARCVTVDSYSGESYWHQNQRYATYLSPAPGKTCALTYVQGHFRGGGESVSIFQSGGSWYLGGTSMQHDVAARARCF